MARLGKKNRLVRRYFIFITYFRINVNFYGRKNNNNYIYQPNVFGLLTFIAQLLCVSTRVSTADKDDTVKVDHLTRISPMVHTRIHISRLGLL